MNLEKLVKKKGNYEEIRYRVNKKVNRLAKRDMDILSLKYLLYEDMEKNLELIDVLFRRDVDIVYQFKKRPGVLWCDKPIDSVREEDRLIFFNPLSLKVESWYNPQSVDYNRHHKNIVNDNKSKYYGCNKEIELDVFNSGHGYIAGKKKLIMYKMFDFDVGVSKGEKTKAVKIHVDRAKKGKDYCSMIHGYPITEHEFRKEEKWYKKV